MATKKKMLEAAAGGAGGAGLDITEVFSTYVEASGAGTTTVNQGIDLAGEGGLWWGKIRNLSGDPDGRFELHDTVRGAGNYLRSDSSAAVTTSSYNFLSSFTSTGYTGWSGVNGYDVVSWTFRKAPKFFTCLTYTGNGVAGRTISHDLGTTVGMLVVKSTSHATSWKVQHRSTGATNALELDDTRGATDVSTAFWNDTAASSTHFTVGTDSGVNTSGRTYVAYLFAHNDGDGGFGPDGDQDIIKCGSYVGNTSTKPVIDLGFEPQWLMIKSSTAGTTDDAWYIVDNMRSFEALPLHDDGSQFLRANATDAESGAGQFQRVASNSTGFSLGSGTGWNANGVTYIFMAIRRGPLALPEAGTEVFMPAITNSGSLPNYNSGFVTDFGMQKQQTSGAWYNFSRLTGTGYMGSDRKDAENSSATTTWDFMDGVGSGSSNTYKGWLWKRAPSFFDVAPYSGSGSSGLVVNHNLGVSPELLIFKNRGSVTNWFAMTSANYGQLNEADGFTSPSFMSFSPTTFTINTAGTSSNASGQNYIAYLFATLDGVSKVSSYIGNGSSQTINAGFTAGARFILIKRTDSAGDWYVWDSVRGVVTGNSPHLSLNTTAAEVTSDDSIDPDSSGFIVNQVAATNINVSSAAYIYYAVA